MTYDLSFFIIAGAAMIFSGISKGGFGSGAGFAGAGLLAVVLDPALALGITLPLFMLVDAVTLKPYWKKWHWPSAKLIILGSLPGVALGAWLYQLADANMIRVFIGTISLLFVLWQVLRWAGVLSVEDRNYGKGVGLFAGAVSGFTSFISHAGGPPFAVYMLSQGVSKTTYQATSVICFWAINIFKFVPYSFLGIFSWQSFEADLYLAPFILLGAWIGIKAHYLVPERLFFFVTYLMLLCTGTKLIWDGLV